MALVQYLSDHDMIASGITSNQPATPRAVILHYYRGIKACVTVGRFIDGIWEDENGVELVIPNDAIWSEMLLSPRA